MSFLTPFIVNEVLLCCHKLVIVGWGTTKKKVLPKTEKPKLSMGLNEG